MNRIIIILASLLSILLIFLFVLGSNGINIKQSQTFDSDKSRIWQHLVDSEKLKIWNPEIIKDEPMDDFGINIGAKSKLTLDEGGKPGVYFTELVTVDVESKLVLKMLGESLGENPMTVSYELLGEGKTTEMVYTSQWQPSGIILTIFTPLIKIVVQNNAKLALSRLKVAVDAR